jgi:hypothetical protein
MRLLTSVTFILFRITYTRKYILGSMHLRIKLRGECPAPEPHVPPVDAMQLLSPRFTYNITDHQLTDSWFIKRKPFRYRICVLSKEIKV